MYVHICDEILDRMIDSLVEEIKNRYTIDGNLELPILIGAGNSGNEIVEKIISKLENDVKNYRINIEQKEKVTTELSFGEVVDSSFLICDSIVNTGSTLLTLRKFLLDRGARDVKTLTVFLRNCAMLIPNFYVSTIDKHQKVIFGLKRYPINFYGTGNIKLLTEQDCGKEVKCGKNYINDYFDDYLYDQKVDSNYHSYIVEEGVEPVGILHIKNRGDKEVFVDTLAINQKKQGNNYGASLLKFLEDHCRMNNIFRVKLYAHESAIGFYKRVGFRETGQQHNLPAYGTFAEMEKTYS